MKKNNLIYILFTILIFCFSCTDLTEDTSSVTPINEAFSTAEEADNFTAQVYAFTRTALADYQATLALQELSSDALVAVDRRDFNTTHSSLHLHDFSYNNFFISRSWDFLLGSVLQCNRAINALEKSDFQDITRPYIAELKVYRALFYLYLLDIYGNVPIVIEHESNGLECTSPKTEVFDFIEDSILENLDDLSKDRGNDERINYYIAQTTLAKLYLNAEVYRGVPAWQKALDACDIVIQSGQYSLESDYFDNFKVDNSSTTEHIFTIRFTERDYWHAPYLHSLSILSLEDFWQVEPPFSYENYLVMADFYNSYSDNDIRKTMFFEGEQIGQDGQPLLDDNGVPLNYTPNISTLTEPPLNEGIRFAKFEIQTCETSNGFNCLLRATHDFPVFRYADVLLMKAEALLRGGTQTGEAISLVNQIRTRAGLVNLSNLTLEELLAERGRELFIEGWRRSDLIRFDQFKKEWWLKPASLSSHIELFPIPQRALGQNSCLRQNPGY